MNPRFDSGHPVIQELRTPQQAVLPCASADEAWQLLRLHGSTVDILVIHREGADGEGDPGLELIAKIQGDGTWSDIPYIITSETWTDAECAHHQESGPYPANAYLRYPFHGKDLTQLIREIFSDEASAEAMPPSNSIEKPSPSGVTIFVPQASAEKPPAAPLPPEKPDFTLAEPLELDAGLLERAPDPSSMEQVSLEDASRSMPSFRMGSGSGMVNEEVSARKILDAKVDNSESDHFLEEDEEPLSLMDEASEEEAPDSEQESSDGFPPLENTQFGLPSELSLTGIELSDDSDSESGSDSLKPAGRPILGKRAGSPNPPEKRVESQDEEDDQARDEMPWLYDQKPGHEIPQRPVVSEDDRGNAIFPGGASGEPDLETLKEYLFLREQDVGALASKLKAAQDQLGNLEDQLRQERSRTIELDHLVEEERRRVQELESEKGAMHETLKSEVADLKFQLKTKSDRTRVLEFKVKEAEREIERVKGRVRKDIRKIRTREKELENRLELLKKDSEVLIGARENKIIELKRKLDLAEFNMDLLQEKYDRERDRGEVLKERLAKAARAMRVAGGFLDQEDREQLSRMIESREVADESMLEADQEDKEAS